MGAGGTPHKFAAFGEMDLCGTLLSSVGAGRGEGGAQLRNAVVPFEVMEANGPKLYDRLVHLEYFCTVEVRSAVAPVGVRVLHLAKVNWYNEVAPSAALPTFHRWSVKFKHSAGYEFIPIHRIRAPFVVLPERPPSDKTHFVQGRLPDPYYF